MLQLKNKTFITLLSFIGYFSTSAQNIFSDKTNQKIWEAKDRSDVVYTKFILKTGNNAQKVLTLNGLQSWHDTSLRKVLILLVKKGNSDVKIAALKAIGQSRDSFYIPTLLRLIHKKWNKKIKPSALVALGKCITKSKANNLIEIKPVTQPGYAECMYRAMLKGVGHKALTGKMIHLLNHSNSINQFYAAWYLARTPFPITSDYILDRDKTIKTFLFKASTEVIIAQITALGKAKVNLSDSLYIKNALSYYRQQNNLQATNENYVNAVADYRAMLNSKWYFDSSNIWNGSPWFKSHLPPLELAYSELISKNCRVFTKNPEINYAPAIVHLLKTKTCSYKNLKLPVTNTIYDKIWQLQLLEDDFQNYSKINTILMQTEEPAIKSAAMESLIKCRNSKGFPENLMSDFNESVSILIKDGDEGAVSIIANAILDKQITLEPNYEPLLKETQKKLNLPQDMEAYIDIEKVLAKINNTTYIKPEAEWNHPINWDFVNKIKADEKIKVTTTQGFFIIQMNVNEAPASVSSILKLVDDGFYNGKYFHRMVPNFVIQGGCPRGDGFGSQNYTIRSEFSSLKYKTGAVGLASAGSNTESCQWFVTHCPAPHLDGRYTIIGYVVEGMEVIHKLGVGDKMLKVERV
jgi:cyclophilin family peptidyl-prolyl cis-trans isomerase